MEEFNDGLENAILIADGVMEAQRAEAKYDLLGTVASLMEQKR